MSKLGKEGQNWHYRNLFKSLNAKNEQCRLFKGAVAGAESGEKQQLGFSEYFFR